MKCKAVDKTLEKCESGEISELKQQKAIWNATLVGYALIPSTEVIAMLYLIFKLFFYFSQNLPHFFVPLEMGWVFYNRST